MSATRKPKRDEVYVDPDRIGKFAPREDSTNAVQPTHERSTANTLKRYDVRLSPGDWDHLDVLARREGTSRGAIIRRLVREYLRENR